MAVQQRRVARTEISGDRQPFLDRPKLLRPKAPPLLAACVEASVQPPRVVRPDALPVLGMSTVQAQPPQVQQAPQILVRYERIPLEHMRPLRDKHGQLVRDGEGRPRLVPK